MGWSISTDDFESLVDNNIFSDRGYEEISIGKNIQRCLIEPKPLETTSNAAPLTPNQSISRAETGVPVGRKNAHMEQAGESFSRTDESS